MIKKSLFYTLCLFLFTGCATGIIQDTKETHLNSSANEFEIVSSPDDFENIIMRNSRFCNIPSQGIALGSSGPELDLPEGSSTGSIKGGSVTATTQDLGANSYLADKILYRTCEIGMSYELTKDEILDLYSLSLEAIVEIVNSNANSPSLIDDKSSSD